jgi:hypothetical protein
MACAVKIHEFQGMTSDKAVVDPGVWDICLAILFAASLMSEGIGDLVLSGMIGIDQLKRGGDGMQFLEEDNLHRGT